jgi:hypothetical protein
MAQDLYSYARRKNGRIASYATIFVTQQMDKKASQMGTFFAGNRLSRRRFAASAENALGGADDDEHLFAGKLGEALV